MLAARVLSKRLLVEMPYSAYAVSGSLYRFSLYSIKCADYMRYSIRYNDNFLADDFNRLAVE
jgi:hypothetical protein